MSAPRLSRLQKAILRLCDLPRGRVGRDRFDRIHDIAVTRAKDPVDVVTKALERMVDRGLLVAYGVRTKEKWFIREVRCTPQGRRVARQLRGQQQALPFRAS